MKKSMLVGKRDNSHTVVSSMFVEFPFFVKFIIKLIYEIKCALKYSFDVKYMYCTDRISAWSQIYASLGL